jgi:hypothetical protein
MGWVLTNCFLVSAHERRTPLKFRELEKEHLQVLAPIEIVGLVREKAARERTSISAATTELLCVALSRDPGAFGIVSREPAAAASA